MSNPLVSIIVITYNSSEYVTETLDSALRQSYSNIELIISDDHSTDNTIDVCKCWLNNNSSRFVRTEIITVPHNTGVTANCNRGLFASRGEWLKFIAGDDVLNDIFLSEISDFLKVKPDAKVIFGDVKCFSNDIEIYYDPKRQWFYNFFFKDNITSSQQYQILLKNISLLFSPSTVINHSILTEIGGFDENYPEVEDAPLWLKLTKSGITLYHFPKIAVYYRVHPKSITTGDCNIIPNYTFNSLMRMYHNEVIPNVNLWWKVNYTIFFKIENLIVNHGNTTKGLKGKLLMLLYKSTNPSLWYSRYKKITCSQSSKNLPDCVL